MLSRRGSQRGSVNMGWLSRLLNPRASLVTSPALKAVTTPSKTVIKPAGVLGDSYKLSDTDPPSSTVSEGLYSYTSGRWLWNEEQQLARRELKFDVSNLARISASAIGSQGNVQISKLSEGSFNKVFLMTLNTGEEVIAKLPNPNAGFKHYTTASEVATMDYLRNVLELPVPKVHSWSSSTDNPVGAEYIIMERCRGVELDRVWDVITDRQKASIVQKLVGFEAAFASARFPGFGSLYYAKDLSRGGLNKGIPVDDSSVTGSGNFAIGPTTDRAFFDHGRSAVDTDRGPWPFVEEYILAGARRELACVEGGSRFPEQQGFFFGPDQYVPTSDVKIRTLKSYMKIAQYLKPKDPTLSKGVLWHTDLHMDNIFVDEEDPTEITAIIDWQAVHISPLFTQARHPKFLQFEGEIPGSFDVNAIKLPSTYSELSDQDQKAARRLRGAQILWKLYEIELACQCDDVNRAIRFGEGLMGRLPALAGNIFSDGELLVEDLLIQLEDQWSNVVDDPSTQACPVHFAEEDRAAHEADIMLWARGIELMTEFLGKIGGHRGWDGWVTHEQFDDQKALMERCFQEFLEQHASNDMERKQWVEAWPFGSLSS